MNKLDELFKERLADMAITPPAHSWKTIETNLSKRNTVVVWLRWAAVLFFGTLLLGSFWVFRADAPTTISKATPATSKPDLGKKTIKHALPVERKNTSNTANQKMKTPAIVVSPVSEESISMETAAQQVVKQTVGDSLVQQAPVVIAAQRPIVLVYTLESIEQPVTTEEAKGNSFQRVVEFARSVKNSESPIGGLRDVKGDLFALDLKKKVISKKQ